jgi:hypothetical protein
MNSRTAVRRGLALVATCLVVTAHAVPVPGLFRAYVSSSGNDANPCTLPQPCRLLPAALGAVSDGGEIWMLDSANYNAAQVDVTKSVTILAVPGVVGSVVATGTHAINIATAGVKVTLRNLVIVPLPSTGGTDGIHMTDGAGLTVENCLIANMGGTGVSVNAAASVRITDTTIRDNGGNGVHLLDGPRATVTRAMISGNGGNGVLVHGLSLASTTTADIADSTMDGNNFGVFAYSLSNPLAVVKASVRDSRVVRNLDTGVGAQSTTGVSVTLSVSNNIISNNGNIGIRAISTGAKIWASGNTVSDNAVGLSNAGGLLESTGNNAVRNNGTDKSGAITVIATE